MNKKIVNALNDQINREMYSAYLYLAMSAHFEDTGLKGFAGWMKFQAKEEMEHAMQIYNYMFEVGITPDLLAIAAPKSNFGEPHEVIKEVLLHEQSITKAIDDIYNMALAEKENRTAIFMQHFIREQIEEEANVRGILDKFKYIEGNAGLMILDQQLASRQV